jgi:hypothetical protein
VSIQWLGRDKPAQTNLRARMVARFRQDALTHRARLVSRAKSLLMFLKAGPPEPETLAPVARRWQSGSASQSRA